MSRRENIINTAKDMVSGFLYYDRKEDESLPRGAIESAINAGEITIDEIVDIFKSGLESSVNHP